MSSNRPATNIYQLMDNELERLHDYARQYTKYLDREEQEYMMRHGGRHPTFQPFHGSGGHNPRGMMTINEAYKKIEEIQAAMLQAFKYHEPLIQERIAEMVLTGKSDETPK